MEGVKTVFQNMASAHRARIAASAKSILSYGSPTPREVSDGGSGLVWVLELINTGKDGS
jgi:hypothetical protein